MKTKVKINREHLYVLLQILNNHVMNLQNHLTELSPEKKMVLSILRDSVNEKIGKKLVSSTEVKSVSLKTFEAEAVSLAIMAYPISPEDAYTRALIESLKLELR